MKMNRKFSIVVSLVQVAFVASAYQTWTDPSTKITWKYEVRDDGNVSIVAETQKCSPSQAWGAVAIPPRINGLPVVCVGRNAFFGCSRLTSVTIPESVTSIESSAFEGCSGLEEVTIPQGVTSIGLSAFSGCSALTSLAIPESVTRIDSQAFCRCSGLTSVMMPSGVTSIGFRTFQGCYGLTSMTIPSGVKHIDEEAFWGCSRLSLVSIPQSVDSIGKSAFRDCSSLISLVISGNGVTSIGESAFEGCSGLANVTISGQVKSIGNRAFYGCSGMVSVSIPSSVASIGSGVFSGCSGLTSVSIPMSVTSIGGSAFSGCSGLTSVTIPENTTEIGPSAFDGCSSLRDVYFQSRDSLPIIGANAFSGCHWDLIGHVPEGWDGRIHVVNGLWLERDGGGADVGVMITNVVVNYVLNSIKPEFATPATTDTGFVNIIAEVRGGCVAVPATWANEYPNFVGKYGSDFTKALTMKTGKKDGAGNEMLVWQDYVAGTDPTDEDDVFTASITIVDGKVTISYTPELDDARKAMRKYTTWGKTSMMDTDWTEVQEGYESEFNFFKVSVEMR